MKYFTLLKNEELHPATSKKVIPKSEFSTLLEAKEIVEKIQNETEEYRKQVAKEGESLKELAEKKGYEEGLEKWNEEISHLENEISKVKNEMEKAIMPLALAAVKKIIGRELELKPDTIADIVATALKSVTHHKKIKIYVRKSDVDILEKNRPRLKALFENLQSLTIATRDDVQEGSCIIETEMGIMNISLEAQLKALEAVFHDYLNAKNGD